MKDDLLQPDNAGKCSVSTSGQLKELLQIASRLVKAPDGRAVLSEREVDQVDQVVLPWWQSVQERVVVRPEGTSRVCSRNEVQVGPMAKHLWRLVDPGI